MKDIFQNLNKEQIKAVEYVDGPSMVIAGAGSGKTRVLTYKVAHLLNRGIDPFNILALTFTNKAAREMKERIIELVGGSDARNVWMGTFHSIFARILRIEGHRLGYPSNFTIYDADDSKRLITNIIKEQDLDKKIYPPNYVAARISGAKINLMTPKAYAEDYEIQQADSMSGKPRLGELYTIYNKRLRKADAMDFDDLLFNTFVILDKFPDALLKYQKKFHYVLVDEYQDTNHVQYMIIRKLSANDENICVVGDDAQSIYAFRGANIQNILSFQKDYPDTKVFKLEQNYRSTKNIVSAANCIIVNNKDQIFKEIWTDNDEGNKIRMIRNTTDTEEGNSVAGSIFELKMSKQLPNKSFAILYRTNAQSRSFEEALRRRNINYRIYGGLSFYKRKEVKDLLAYFRVVINNKDEEALLRIINYPARGIGKTTLEKVTVEADKANMSVWEVMEDPKKYGVNLNSGVLAKISGFVTMIKSFSTKLKSSNAYELAKLIAQSSGLIKDLYEDKTPEGVSRYENIEELLNGIKDFADQEILPEEVVEGGVRTLDAFMQDIALLTDADDKDKQDDDHVSLMTVHAAKGLEFPYVFVVGMEENLFPSIMSLHSRADLEEERRLFYVAITRAMKQLTISFAESRYRYGLLTPTESSRFVDEIDDKYIDFPQKVIQKPFFGGSERRQAKTTPFDPMKKKNLKKISNIESDPSFSATEDEIQVGMEVEHQRFGKGKVQQIEGFGGSKKATVFFHNVGQKQLLLKFAKLKVLK